MSSVFLKADWKHLLMLNYEIDPTILQPHVPVGTELDLFKGRCLVSMVGFMFLNTRLKGVPIPFHRNFEEVNLRFYVKRVEGSGDEQEVKRGVVFIKEIVPKPALSLVARVFYNENYVTHPMEHHLALANQQVRL